jgi:hypothetical protein
MRTQARFFRDKEFSDPHLHNHFQRCTEAAWRDALLHNQDQVIVGGTVRRLVGKSIGFGVVEVRIEDDKRMDGSKAN